MGADGFLTKNYTRLFLTVRSLRMLDRKPVYILILMKCQSLKSVVFKLWQAEEADISFKSVDVFDKFKVLKKLNYLII